MSNKQIFTSYDVYGFKRALALWSSKNNALRSKWLSEHRSLEEDIEELHGCKPSMEKDYRLRDKESSLYYVEQFLKDLSTPCDTFISEFEFQDVGK